MRWPIFFIVLFITVVAETSLRQVLVFEALGHISPTVMPALVVFVALFAPRRTTLWAAWIAGLLMDLNVGLPQRGLPELYVPGPHALGYVFAAVLVLQLRSMVFRRRVLTFAVLTLAAVLASSLIAVSIYVVRSWLPGADDVLYPTDTGALRELGERLGVAVYSALLAVPVGWLLLASLPAWGFTNLNLRQIGRG